MFPFQLRIEKKSGKLFSDNQEMRNTQLLRAVCMEKRTKKQMVRRTIFEN